MKIELNKKYFLKNTENGEVATNASIIISKENSSLIFDFEIIDDSLFSPYSKDNEDIYHGDVCEVFISFDGDPRRYLEYEVSPYNIKFLGLIDNPTLDNPILTKINPLFESEVVLNKNGYHAKIVVDLKDNDINNIRFNCFNIDSDKDRPQKLYALNPTFKRNFHLSNYFVEFNK